jgi:hypothetical protein
MPRLLLSITALLLAAGAVACSSGDDPEPTPQGAVGSEWEAQPVKDYPYPVEMFTNEAPRAEGRHFADGEFRGYNTHEYGTVPPTSGKHIGELAQAGYYDAIPIPNEIAVHNMEHGYVILWFNCNADPMLVPDDCAVLLNELTAITQSLTAEGRSFVMTPHHTMASRIALTAWQFMDRMDEIDEERILAFVETFECHYDPEGTCG